MPYVRGLNVERFKRNSMLWDDIVAMFATPAASGLIFAVTYFLSR